MEMEKRIKAKCYYILVTKLEVHEKASEEFMRIDRKNKLVLLLDEPYREIADCSYLCLEVPKGVHFMDRQGWRFRYYYDKLKF